MTTVYRTVNTSFWTDPKVRTLKHEGKLLLLYLITCPHTNVCGIYYAPEIIVLHETGLKKATLDTLWDTLSRLELVIRDAKSDVVWIVNMMKYQGRGEKVALAAANQLLTLHNSFLVKKFLARYPAVEPLYTAKVMRRGSHGVCDRVSDGDSRFGNPDMDSDSDQDNDQEQDSDTSCTEADIAASIPLVTFPCVGKSSEPREWHLTDSHVAEWSGAYPSVDVITEAKQALAWVNADLTRRKTAKGMGRFLTGWLARSHNRGGNSAGVGSLAAFQRPTLQLGLGGTDDQS